MMQDMCVYSGTTVKEQKKKRQNNQDNIRVRVRYKAVRAEVLPDHLLKRFSGYRAYQDSADEGIWRIDSWPKNGW